MRFDIRTVQPDEVCTDAASLVAIAFRWQNEKWPDFEKERQLGPGIGQRQWIGSPGRSLRPPFPQLCPASNGLFLFELRFAATFPGWRSWRRRQRAQRPRMPPHDFLVSTTWSTTKRLKRLQRESEQLGVQACIAAKAARRSPEEGAADVRDLSATEQPEQVVRAYGRGSLTIHSGKSDNESNENDMDAISIEI